MGALALMRRGLSEVTRVDVRPKPGIIPMVVDTAIGGGTSYVLGRAHVRYRDTSWAKHLPLATGVGGKVAAIAASAFLGPGWVASGLDAVGQAGINTHMLTMGIQDEMKSSGRKVIILPMNVAAPAGLPAGSQVDTVLGDIPPAAPGTRWLDRAEINNIASMHG